MDPKTIVEHWGSVEAARKELGVTNKAIYQWLAAGKVPKMRQYQIALLTRGKFKVVK